MKKDEEKVAQYLTKHNLTVSRFSEKETRNKKTPDFQVLRNGLLFYCEVKSIRKDDYPDLELGKAEQGKLTGGARKDPVYNRLTSDIHKAANM